MKMDDDGGLDEDGDGISDEVQEVETVLWEHCNLHPATRPATCILTLHPAQSDLP